MTLIYILVTLRFIIILLVFLLSFSISEKIILNREELSSYECGFEHHRSSRIPFSLRYFFLTLIFLLFDLEIVLMLFIPFSLYSTLFNFTLVVLFVFLSILFLGLIYE